MRDAIAIAGIVIVGLIGGYLLWVTFFVPNYEHRCDAYGDGWQPYYARSGEVLCKNGKGHLRAMP